MRISRTAALQKIRENGTKMLTVTFKTKNNESRTINGMVKRPIINTDLGYIKVYEMKTKGTRNVNLQTIESLSLNGNKYVIR